MEQKVISPNMTFLTIIGLYHQWN